MALTIFQALDNAIQAGSLNLTSANIVVHNTPSTTQLLAAMCEAGFLQKSAAKTPKFSVTPEGRARWEQEAPPERRREIQEREQRQERELLLAFLQCVEQKQGVKLKQAELTKYSEQLRKKACDNRLVQPGTKANSYVLLPAGEATLLAGQPPAQQLDHLRKLQQRTVSHWQAAQQHLRENVKQLNGQGGQALKAALEDINGKYQQANATFETAVRELAGFVGLLTASQQFKASVEAAEADLRQKVEAERARIAELEASLRQMISEQQEKLDAFDLQIRQRLDDLAKRISADDKPKTTASDPPTSQTVPTETAIWEATQRAYQELHKETIRIGGFVKIPEITDAVLRSCPGINAKDFHDWLQKWQKKDRLTLQLCDNPRLEPRASEGIQSPKGLLFYIKMR